MSSVFKSLNSSYTAAGTSTDRKQLTPLLSASFTLLKATNNLLYLSVLTVFLKKAGATSLPWVYLAVNIGFIAFQYLIMSRIAGKEGHWLLSRISFPVVFFSAFAGFLMPTESLPALIGFLCVAMLVDLVSTQAFGAMLNHFLTLQESKKNLSVIYAFGSLGYILSGILLKFVIEILGVKGLLYGNALILLCLNIILFLLKNYEVERIEEVARETEIDKVSHVKDSQEEKKAAPEIPESTLKHPLARLLVFSSGLILFNKYLIDFLFAGAVSVYFYSSNDLASFMGAFGASADFVVIGLQTLVMKRIFSRFSIGVVLSAMPIILASLCFLNSTSNNFYLIVIIQFLVLINSKNFSVPATTILLGAVSQKKRVFFRRDISVACSFASTFVGIFLIAVKGNLPFKLLFFVAGILYSLLALVHYRLDKAYLITLKETFVSGDHKDLDEHLRALRCLGDTEKLENLTSLLQSEDPELRLNAIEEIDSFPLTRRKEILLQIFQKEQDPKCLASISRKLLRDCGGSIVCQLEMMLAETEDERLRADIIEALGNSTRAAGFEIIVDNYLFHKHHRVKSNALMSMLRLTMDSEKIESALVELAKMAKSKEPIHRASAAAVMGELGLPMFTSALDFLSEDPDVTVVKNSLNALAKINTPKALEVIESLIGHKDHEISMLAEKAFEEASKSNFNQVSRLMGQITAEERKKLATAFKSVGNRGDWGLVSNVLMLENETARRIILKVFEQGDMFAQKLLARCIVRESEDQIIFQSEPVWNELSNHFFRKIPTWAELLHVSLLISEDSESSLEKQAVEFLGQIFAEAKIVLENEIEGLGIYEWKERARVAVQVVALTSSEPGTTINAINDLTASNSYKRSVAQEFIEAKLGKKLPVLITSLTRLFAMESISLEQLNDEIKNQQVISFTDEKIFDVKAMLKRSGGDK